MRARPVAIGIAAILLPATAGAQSLDTTPGWFADGIHSSQFPSQFGRSAAFAGDVDRDGHDDILTSEPFFFTPCCPCCNQQGLVLSFPGSPTGPTTFDWSRVGENIGTTLGYVVAAAGDVDGDGFDDVVYSSGSGFGDGTHRIHVQLGSEDGLDLGWEYDSGLLFGTLGPSVAAGDVNGDGFDDILGGIPHHPSEAEKRGRLLAFHGGPLGLGTHPNWDVVGTENQRLGLRLSSAGDVDGDGFDDVLAGASPNMVHLYRGSSTGLGLTPSWSDATGGIPAAAGDVNGDGVDDFVLGGGNSVRLFLGGPDGPGVAPDQTLFGAGGFGAGLATAGDLNGDGFDDLLVGAPDLALELGEGRVFLYLGGPSGLRTTPAWFSDDLAGSIDLGRSVGAGDANGDRYTDVLAGDPDRGRIHVFFGHPNLLPGPAGAIGTANTGQLRFDRTDDGTLELSWGESCSPAEEDFAVYAGEIGGTFAADDRITCTTFGRTFVELDLEPGDRFYLVVPQSADREGSYGTDGENTQRLPSVAACLPQALGLCVSGP